MKYDATILDELVWDNLDVETKEAITKVMYTRIKHLLFKCSLDPNFPELAEKELVKEVFR